MEYEGVYIRWQHTCARGSFAHTIFPGKHYHLLTQFSQVNVTFAHVRFSQINGMIALARLHSQAKPSFPVKAADTSCLMIHISDTPTGIVMFRTETNLKFMNQDVHLFGDGTFQFCPKYFYQLNSIHEFMNGQCVPNVFVFFSCCHPRQSSTMNTCFFSTEVCSKFDVTSDMTHLNLDFVIVVNEAAAAR